MEYVKLFEAWSLSEAADTDLELKSLGKRIFSVMKSHGLNPNYISGSVKLDKAHDSAIIMHEDRENKAGLLTVNVWAWAIKDGIQELGDAIVKAAGHDFEVKSGQRSSHNDIVYTMLIRKKHKK